MPDNLDLIVTGQPALLDGTLTATAFDSDGDPNKVIDKKKGGKITVQWQVTGALKNFIWGTWHVSAYAESIGPGSEFELGQKDVPIVFPQTTWTTDIDLTPAVLNAHSDGAYDVSVILTHTLVPGVRTRIAGFVDMKMLQFYTYDIP